MERLHTDKEVENKGVNNSDDLDELLAQYNKSLTVDKVENTEPEKPSTPNRVEPLPPTQEVNSDSENLDPNHWVGNPIYYQSGKKKGQKRTVGKKQIVDTEPPKQEMEISGSLIDGALFLMLIDLLFPLIITYVNNSYTKVKISAEALQMTEKQKKDLTPISNEVVKYLTLKANPVALLLIAMGGIYGMNTMAARQDAISKIKKQNQKEHGGR